MKNYISKIVIGLIVVIIALGILICYKNISDKEMEMQYKFENNKLFVSVHSNEWIEVPYDFSYTIDYLEETNNGQYRDGTYQLTDKKIVFYREQNYSKILDNEGNAISEFDESYNINYLVYSNDKGKTWEQVQVTTTSSRDSFISINFESKDNGSMKLKGDDGDSVYYYKTIDGGQEWEIIEDNKVEDTTNTSRIFDKEPKVAVSNSNTEPGTCVYKAFNILEKEKMETDNFIIRNELCFKKVVSYDEYLKYKNMWSGIRELTQEDFINYYLILVIDKNPNKDKAYTFKRLLVEDGYLNLHIAQRDANIKENQECVASGIAIIIPNRTDFEEDKINVIQEK